jgi:hypothetical protein
MSDDIPTDDLYHQVLDVDRPRGLLTKGDRKLILQVADYDNEQQVRDARYRLRNHLKAALLDAQLLTSSTYSIDEYAAVLRSADRDLGSEQMIVSMILAKSLQQVAMNFLWAGVEHGGFDELGETDLEAEQELAHIVQQSIRKAAQRSDTDEQVIDIAVDVDIDITVTREEPDASNIVRRVFRGGGDYEELLQYLANAELSRADVAAIRAQFDELDLAITLEQYLKTLDADLELPGGADADE